MSRQQNNPSNQLSGLKQYDIPVLRQGKESYISFNAFDPAAGKMRRKKIKVNHRKKSERKRYCSALIRRIIDKLEQGWTPTY